MLYTNSRNSRYYCFKIPSCPNSDYPLFIKNMGKLLKYLNVQIKFNLGVCQYNTRINKNQMQLLH